MKAFKQLIPVLAFVGLASVFCAVDLHAQDSLSQIQRTALGILNDAPKNEGKEVVLDCAYVRPWWHTSDLAKLAYAQGLAVFLAYDKQGDKVPVIIAAGEENAFMKEFGSEGEYQEYLRGYKVRTRKLRGIVSGWDDNQQGIYRHYLRYGGAPKWVDSTSSSKDSNVAEIAPQIKKVAFDEKPMMSFSYDGRRLIEARIVDVGPDGVVLTSKDSASVTVPLERAVKMPDLQMMAREAMEAALSVGASKSVNFQR